MIKSFPDCCIWEINIFKMTGFQLIIEKRFVIFTEFKVLLQSLYHHPNNNNKPLTFAENNQSYLPLVIFSSSCPKIKANFCCSKIYLQCYAKFHELLLNRKWYSALFKKNQTQDKNNWGHKYEWRRRGTIGLPFYLKAPTCWPWWQISYLQSCCFP